MRPIKVVRKTVNGLRSCSHFLTLNYGTEVWTKAPANSGLLLFDSIENAVRFEGDVLEPSEYRVYECKVRNPMRLPDWRLDAQNGTTENLRLIWARKKIELLSNKTGPLSITRWPRGTRAFKFAKLYRQITIPEMEEHCNKIVQNFLDEFDLPETLFHGASLASRIKIITSNYIYLLMTHLEGRFARDESLEKKGATLIKQPNS